MSIGFLHTWRLAITPLSPLHIGTGEDYEPTQYVIDEDRLFRFTPEVALRALAESARAELLRIVQGKPSVEMLKQIQAFFYQYRDRLIPAAGHLIRTLPTISAEYAERVGKTAQREDKRDIINQLRIMRTFTNPASHRPILPGSSLKGAIRTALLDRINGNAPLTQEEKALKPSQRNLALQQRLFRYRAGQFELDPMRLVQVADAADQRPPGTVGTEVRYAVNRKRQPVIKDGQEVQAMAENLRQVVECISPLQPRAFRGRLTLQNPGDLRGRKLPDASLRWNLADLAGACNAFYRPILDRELKELRARGFLDSGWGDAVTALLASLAPALQAGRAFLVRVGFHSGAESVTLNGVRDIKIMKGKGQTPEYLPFTKTVWLAARDRQDRRDLIPFGWALVETAPEGEPWPPWGGSRDQRRANEETDWLAAAQARQAELAERFAQALAREQAERAAAEAQAMRAAESAARRAGMSAEARQIDDLRALLERDRSANLKQAGGELSNTLSNLLKQALDGWQHPADCRALADLAEEAYRFLGWPGKKKDRQAQIKALRDRAAD